MVKKNQKADVHASICDSVQRDDLIKHCGFSVKTTTN